MKELLNHMESCSAQLSNQGENPESYTQKFAVGLDVNNTPIKVTLFDPDDLSTYGQPYISIGNVQTDTWGAASALKNPDNLRFQSVSIVTGFANAVYVVLLSDAGKIYFIYQETGNQNWRWWGQMKKGEGQSYKWLATGVGNSGNVQVVLMGEDDKPYLLWQNRGSGSWYWGNQLPCGGSTFKNFEFAKGNGGNLQLVLTGTDGAGYLIWQDNGSGTWSWYGKLPGDGNTNFKKIQVFLGNGLNLQAVYQDANENLYLIWQDHASGAWCWYGRLPLDQSVFNGKIAFYSIVPLTGDINERNHAVYVGKQISESTSGSGTEVTFEIFEINQNSSGAWSWKGKYDDETVIVEN